MKSVLVVAKKGIYAHSGVRRKEGKWSWVMEVIININLGEAMDMTPLPPPPPAIFHSLSVPKLARGGSRTLNRGGAKDDVHAVHIQSMKCKFP